MRRDYIPPFVIGTGVRGKYMLAEFDPFMRHMERVLGPKNVTALRHRSGQTRGSPEYKVKWYDERTHQMKVEARARTGKQEFLLNVEEELSDVVRMLVDTYNNNSRWHYQH